MPKLGVSEHKIVKSSKKGDFRKISGMSQGGGAAGPPDFGGSEVAAKHHGAPPFYMPPQILQKLKKTKKVQQAWKTLYKWVLYYKIAKIQKQKYLCFVS